MAVDDDTPNPSADNNLRLIEAAHLTAIADPALNAIRVEIADQAGAGVAVLLGPQDTVNFVMTLLAAQGQLVPG